MKANILKIARTGKNTKKPYELFKQDKENSNEHMLMFYKEGIKYTFTGIRDVLLQHYFFKNCKIILKKDSIPEREYNELEKIIKKNDMLYDNF
ncbi:MAG: hypothetical protein AB1571_01320 [Nanoarchaeota archaeon]